LASCGCIPITKPKIKPLAFAKILKHLEIKKPSPIQMQCWRVALSGANGLDIAPIGSGKTLAYSLPMIPHIKAHIAAVQSKSQPSAYNTAVSLVLVPTRELAIQVALALKPFRRVCGIYCAAIYGGHDKDDQLDEVRRHGGANIIVATPRRLLGLIYAKTMTISNDIYLVINEANRM
jgi:ATP-dependent RNA helicase DBP3